MREVSRKWNADIDTYLKLKANPELSPRVLNVRYEDVVDSPQEVMQPILQSMGLEIEQQMLTPEAVEKEQLGYSVNVDGVWYTDGMFSQSLNNLSVSGWRQNLSSGQRTVANLMQCRNLERMGYPVTDRILRLRNLMDRARGRKAE